jgi:hypothetical protein
MPPAAPAPRSARRFRGLQVYRRVKFDRQLNRQVRRLFAAENAMDIGRRAAKYVQHVGSVGKQTAVFNIYSVPINRRDIVSRWALRSAPL